MVRPGVKNPTGFTPCGKVTVVETIQVLPAQPPADDDELRQDATCGNWLCSISRRSSASFTGKPPPKPVSAPFAPITR